MFGLGVLFAVLWFVSLRLGARIDRERAAFDAEYPDQTPQGGLPPRAAGDPPAAPTQS
jgi:hypothetical protein